MAKTQAFTKTNNQSVILNTAAVNETPDQAQLNAGDRCIVSPFKLMIHDGSHYLLAFDDNSRLRRTYRVDRMKDIERAGEAREGGDIFRRIDLKDYADRVFSVFKIRASSNFPPLF